MIEVKNLVKNYETNGIVVQALRGLDLSIEAGEFTAIAGQIGRAHV